MSKFTTEVRFICESVSGLSESSGFNNIETILNNSVTEIFNFPFPIFDEAYRIPLEKKILRHYYTREICEETVGLWKLRMSQKLNEIMPYYNQLYSSELLNFNPLYDVDLTTNHQRVNNGQMSNNGTTGNTETQTGQNTDTHNENDAIHNWDRYSDTPQGALTNVENDTYLTNARKIDETKTNTGGYTKTNSATITNNGTSSLTGTNHDVEDYLEHVVGKTASKSYAHLIKEYREIFLNIDAMVIDELSGLFFGLWE